MTPLLGFGIGMADMAMAAFLGREMSQAIQGFNLIKKANDAAEHLTT